MSAIRSLTDKDWIKRNKSLFVTLLVALTLLIGGGIVVMVMNLIKSSDAYRLGFDKAAASPAVIEAIGSPIEAGMFVSGNIQVSNASGQADLSIPVHAPKGAGTVYLHAKKSLGEWTLTALVFENDATHRRTDLLQRNGNASE